MLTKKLSSKGCRNNSKIIVERDIWLIDNPAHIV